MSTTFLGQCFRLYSIKIKSINGIGVLDFIRKALFLDKVIKTFPGQKIVFRFVELDASWHLGFFFTLEPH